VTKINLPENSIFLMLTLNPATGNMKLSSGGNVPNTLDPKYSDALLDISYGLNLIVDQGVEYLATSGSLLRMIEEDAEEEEVIFEPDDELLEKISEAKVVKFPKKLH
jgi:hypothetical protein